MIGDIVLAITIYGVIGLMSGMTMSLVFLETDPPGGVDEDDFAVAAGVLWPIVMPIVIVIGAIKAVKVTAGCIGSAFVGIWSAYVNRLEERVK